MLYKSGVISAATLSNFLGMPLYKGGEGLPMSQRVTTLSLVAVKSQLGAERCASTAYMSTSLDPSPRQVAKQTRLVGWNRRTSPPLSRSVPTPGGKANLLCWMEQTHFT